MIGQTDQTAEKNVPAGDGWKPVRINLKKDELRDFFGGNYNGYYRPASCGTRLK